MGYSEQAQDYRRIERAIEFLDRNQERQPRLAEVAASVGLSEYHFQRLFGRWVGISPKRFLQYLTVAHARRLLDQSRGLLDVTYATGLSSPARLHDLFVACEAVTPGQYKRRGEGMRILYGFHASPFGECMLALSERGVCGLSFVAEGQRELVLADLARRWGRASLEEDPAATAAAVDLVFSVDGPRPAPLHLLLKGTNFQLKVWEALLRIPPGRAVAYQDVAAWVGAPGAARAVGQAVGENPIAYVIPCHRVLRRLGGLGGYRWGTARKVAMLGWEAARADARGEG